MVSFREQILPDPFFMFIWQIVVAHGLVHTGEEIFLQVIVLQQSVVQVFDGTSIASSQLFHNFVATNFVQKSVSKGKLWFCNQAKPATIPWCNSNRITFADVFIIEQNLIMEASHTFKNGKAFVLVTGINIFFIDTDSNLFSHYHLNLDDGH